MSNGDDVRKLEITPQVREALAAFRSSQSSNIEHTLTEELSQTIAFEKINHGVPTPVGTVGLNKLKEAATDVLTEAFNHPELKDRLFTIIQNQGISKEETYKLVEQAAAANKLIKRDNNLEGFAVITLTRDELVQQRTQATKTRDEIYKKLLGATEQGINVAIDQAIAPVATPKSNEPRQR